ncbi:MAG: FAD-dependent oxidoreductase [Hydrogenibacillus schlegelii]|nr:FAD-dependent oxidoreductase [Hydrogenibacillus schlegelii]
MIDVVVIGGGPAGASAALFLAKAGLSVVVVDAGQGITKKAWIRNHLGLPDVTGPELVELGRRQATAFGARWIDGTVVDAGREGDGFRLTVERDGARETLKARQLLLATGLWTDLAERIGVHIVPAKEPRVKANVAVDPEGRTNVPGVWAAGTVAGASVHTIVTAGDGARVAINLLSALRGERYVDHDLLSDRPAGPTA